MFCRLEKDSAFLVILGQREPAGFFKKTVAGWVEIADKASLRKTLLFSLSTDRFSIADMDGDGIDELFIADTGFLRKIVYDPVEDDFSIARQYNTPKRKQDARIPVPYQRKNANSLVYFDPKDDHLFLIGEKEPTNLRGNNQKELPPIIPCSVAMLTSAMEDRPCFWRVSVGFIFCRTAETAGRSNTKKRF